MLTAEEKAEVSVARGVRPVTVVGVGAVKARAIPGPGRVDARNARQPAIRVPEKEDLRIAHRGSPGDAEECHGGDGLLVASQPGPRSGRAHTVSRLAIGPARG